MRDLLGVIQDIWPGGATLAQMRVRSAILAETLSGQVSTVSDLSRELSIPDSTVSRTVLALRDAGTVDVVSALGDARTRSIRVRPSVLESEQMQQYAQRVLELVRETEGPRE